MKIFISHSSKNKDYGNALVELLRGVGLKEDEVVFTSNNENTQRQKNSMHI